MSKNNFCIDAQKLLEEEHLMIAKDLGLQGKMLKATSPTQVESKVLGQSREWYWFVSRSDAEGKMHHAIITDAEATAATAEFFAQTAERFEASDPKSADLIRAMSQNLRGEC